MGVEFWLKKIKNDNSYTFYYTVFKLEEKTLWLWCYNKTKHSIISKISTYTIVKICLSTIKNLIFSSKIKVNPKVFVL